MAELHPRAQQLRTAARKLPPLYTMSVDEARDRLRSAFLMTELPELPQTGDITIESGDGYALRARFYHPAPGQVRPILVYAHGGGWAFNDIDVFDRLCLEIASEADCVVVSVDYRRSPEHRYPIARDDVRAVLEWAAANAASIGGDPGRIALGGDSAGGAIAAGLAKLVRDDGGPALSALFLLYPITDYMEPRRASYDERGPGFVVDDKFMCWIWNAYLPDGWLRDDPYLFPLEGELAGLPPTVICVAEYDILRDEGKAFAEKLAEAGVAVDLIDADDQMHGFAMYIDSIDRAAGLVRTACHRLNAAITA